MEIYGDARPLYGGIYRCHPDIARSINIKSFYDHLWLYGLYGVLYIPLDQTGFADDLLSE